MNAEQSSSHHLANGQVAAYVDGRLPSNERATVEGHLAECAECRAEVVDVVRLQHSIARRRRWLIAVPAAAAAAIVLLIAWPREAGPPGTPPLRDGGEGVATVVAVEPGPDGVVARNFVRFVWRSLGADVSYRVTVTDERGDVVWSTASADTGVVLAAAVRLTPATPYFWYVDALFANGRSATSGVQGFRTAP